MMRFVSQWLRFGSEVHLFLRISSEPYLQDLRFRDSSPHSSCMAESTAGLVALAMSCKALESTNSLEELTPNVWLFLPRSSHGIGRWSN